MSPRHIAGACAQLAFAPLTLLPSPARADLPMRPPPNATASFGGERGADFIARCPDNMFLIGIRGSASNLVNAIQPLCSSWDRKTQRFFPPFIRPLAGSADGTPITVVCEPGAIVSALLIAANSGSYAASLRYVILQCKAVYPTTDNDHTSYTRRFGDTEGAPAPSEQASEQCRRGLIGNGLYGRAGGAVTRLGLLCAVEPFVLGIPVAAPPPPGKTVVGSIGRVHLPRDNIGVAGRARPTPAPRPAPLPQPAPPDPTPDASPSPHGTIFDAPMIIAANGQRVALDFCREYQGACGKPAADAWCLMEGFVGAGRFLISAHVGYTAVISDGRLCDGPNCDSFAKIECLP